MTRRGRKPYTPEQRAVAVAAAKGKYRNISVDADLVDTLNSIADKLEPQFGFRPTLSQALRYLIKHAFNA